MPAIMLAMTDCAERPTRMPETPPTVNLHRSMILLKRLMHKTPRTKSKTLMHKQWLRALTEARR